MPDSTASRAASSRLITFRETVPWLGLLSTLVFTNQPPPPVDVPITVPAPSTSSPPHTNPQFTFDPDDIEAVPTADELAAPEGASPTRTEHAPLPISALMLMVDDNTIQLAAHPESSWGRGELRPNREDVTIAAQRDVDITRLPPDLRELLGARVDVYATNGRVCSGTVTEPRLSMRYDGWLDSYFADEAESEHWNEDGRLPDDFEQRFGEAFTTFLVATLETDASCDGAVWARQASLPAPTVLARVERDASDHTLRQATRGQVRRSASYTEMKAAYQAYAQHDPGESTASWSTFLRDSYRLNMWRDVTGDHVLAHVAYGAFDVPCGDGFDLGVAQWYVPDPKTGARLSGIAPAEVAAVFDANNDGHLEWIARDGDSLTLHGDENSERSTAIVFWGCGC